MDGLNIANLIANPFKYNKGCQNITPKLAPENRDNQLIKDYTLNLDWLEVSGVYSLDIMQFKEKINQFRIGQFIFKKLEHGTKRYDNLYEIYSDDLKLFAKIQVNPRKLLAGSIYPNHFSLKVENEHLYVKGLYPQLKSIIVGALGADENRLTFPRIDIALDYDKNNFDIIKTYVDVAFSEKLGYKQNYVSKSKMCLDARKIGKNYQINIGSKTSDISFKAYEKTNELAQVQKTIPNYKSYVQSFWAKNNLIASDVIRLEIMFKNKALKKHGFNLASVDKDLSLIYFASFKKIVKLAHNDNAQKTRCTDLILFNETETQNNLKMDIANNYDETSTYAARVFLKVLTRTIFENNTKDAQEILHLICENEHAQNLIIKHNLIGWVKISVQKWANQFTRNELTENFEQNYSAN